MTKPKTVTYRVAADIDEVITKMSNAGPSGRTKEQILDSAMRKCFLPTSRGWYEDKLVQEGPRCVHGNRLCTIKGCDKAVKFASSEDCANLIKVDSCKHGKPVCSENDCKDYWPKQNLSE